MRISDLPLVECTVTFLTEAQGGRHYAFSDNALSNGRYRPHFVVGDPQQRQAILEKRELIIDGRSLGLRDCGIEEMLGIAFVGGPEKVEAGVSLSATVALIFAARIAYEKLVPGATFTIREGSKIVGFGTVTARLDFPIE